MRYSIQSIPVTFSGERLIVILLASSMHTDGSKRAEFGDFMDSSQLFLAGHLAFKNYGTRRTHPQNLAGLSAI